MLIRLKNEMLRRNNLLEWNLELGWLNHDMTYWVHSISQNICSLKSHSTWTWRSTMLMSSFHRWFESSCILLLSWVLNQGFNHWCAVLSKLTDWRTDRSWAKIISLSSFIDCSIFSFNELWHFIISKYTAISLLIL